MKRLPVVALVGRMNVGKSTLFNRLSSTVKSIVLDYTGVTRDIVRDAVTWLGKSFELCDTGGLIGKKNISKLHVQVEKKVLEVVAHAEVLIFVVDGAVGLLPDDVVIMRRIQKLHKPIIVAVNKSDVRIHEEHIHEFEALGGVALISVAAEQSKGIGDLLDCIVHYLPSGGMGEEIVPKYRVMLLGKPNVGKSSLMNQLVQYERSIVYDEPGTTREVIAEPIMFYKEQIIIADTPGLRRQSAVSEILEKHMVHSALQELSQSDIVLLVIDGTEGRLVDQELKLGFYAFTERYKALVLVINKIDSMTEEQHTSLGEACSSYMHLLKKIPVIHISCISGKHVGKIMPLVHSVWEQHSREFLGVDLYHLFTQALLRKPLMHKENRLVVHQVRQLAKSPITIGLAVNEPVWFGPSQCAFFEGLMRKEYGLRGAPIKFIVRKKL